MPVMLEQFWLISLGLVVGAFGTLIGAGGGFVLMPVLILLYPSDTPEFLTSISLVVVFVNALSGSIAYGRMKRIDYKSGLSFSAAAIPGAILGALTTTMLPRRLFDAVFGVLLISVAPFLLLRSGARREVENGSTKGQFVRNLMDAGGTQYIYSYNAWLGMGVSVVVGYLSSLLGIGGGIIHVPVMAFLLNFPIHVATATSHFVLALTSATGTVVHVAMGSFTHGLRAVIFLSIGVAIGAQLGARLAKRIHGSWIIRGLALGLGFVGIRILIMSF